jgi:hypothetical protein
VTRIALTILTVAVWALAIVAAHTWSVNGSGWATTNALIVAVFGLAGVVPVLLLLWRTPRRDRADANR